MGVAHPINELFASQIFDLETFERVDEHCMFAVNIPYIFEASLGFFFGHYDHMAILRLKFIVIYNASLARHGYPCSFGGAAAGDVEEVEACIGNEKGMIVLITPIKINKISINIG